MILKIWYGSLYNARSCHRRKAIYDFPYPQYDFPYPQYDFPYPQYDFPYASRPSHPIFAPQHRGGWKEPQDKPKVK